MAQITEALIIYAINADSECLLEEIEKEGRNLIKIAIKPIPRKQYGKYDAPHHSFGVGTADGLYSGKGVLLLPNFEDKGKNYLESLEYRINSSDSENGAFNWVILSMIHECNHLELLRINAAVCAAFDNIDKDNSGNYILSALRW